MKLIIDILIKNIYHQLKIVHYTVKTQGVNKKIDETMDKIYLATRYCPCLFVDLIYSTVANPFTIVV